MALINDYNKQDFIKHYANHYKVSIKETSDLVEKNPQILEDYAEYVMNREDFE